MKNLFYFILLCGVLVSCAKDGITGFKVVPDAMISIMPVDINTLKNVSMRSATLDTVHLSDLEIVKQATVLSGWNVPVYGNQPVGWGFASSQRDTITPALKMWASGIINENGYVPDFIEAKDLVFCRPDTSDYTKIDTIAYISNSDLSEAKDSILTAYNAGDTATVYRLFDYKFKFRKITGKEWREKKALNEQ